MKALNSVKNQTFGSNNFEIIIVNDGSTDETGNVLRQIHDDRLILIEQANQGVYAARNAALALHQGE